MTRWHLNSVIALLICSVGVVILELFDESTRRVPPASLAASDFARCEATPTYGGCFRERYPFLHNGGFRRYNDSHFIVVAHPASNIVQLLHNVTCRHGTAVVHAVEVSRPPEGTQCDGGVNDTLITGVAWIRYTGTPYHELYYPTGFFGRHALQSEFAQRVGITWPRMATVTYYSDRLKSPSVVARHHYQQLFTDDFPSRISTNESMWRCGYLLFIHSDNIKRQFWSLPLLNVSVKFARSKFDLFDEPQVLDRSVFVEKRMFLHRPRHQQLRGYRPEVWQVIERVAQRHNLTLEVIDMKPLTFEAQRRELHSRRYVVATEGSFSVWIPFLRRGTICLSIYDHYGNGWHIPEVHLPVALLGDRLIKMVFVSIFNYTIPTEADFSNELFHDTAPQLKIVTVPDDAALKKHLLTDVITGTSS